MPPQIKIRGGEFTRVTGNYKEYDCSTNVTNINSNNVRGNEVIKAYNDDSKIFNGPRSPQHREDNDDGMDTSADTGPPPPQPHEFIPPHILPAKQNVINRDSFNMNYNHIRDSNNNISRTYYNGPPPPANQRVHRSNTSPSVGNAPVQMLPQHRWTDSQHMYQTFSRATKQTPSSSEQNNMPEYDDETHDSDDADSLSHGTGAKDCVNTRLANLSIRDPTLSPTPNRSPPVIFSDTRTPTQPQLYPMSSSNAIPYNNSNLYTHPRQDDIHRSSLNNTPPISTFGINPPPSSGGGPTIRVIHGNLTRYNMRKHQTNYGSFNVTDNTIRESFNNNPLVDYSGNGQKGSNKASFSGGN